MSKQYHPGAEEIVLEIVLQNPGLILQTEVKSFRQNGYPLISRPSQTRIMRNRNRRKFFKDCEIGLVREFSRPWNNNLL